jgi:hypothetical protein
MVPHSSGTHIISGWSTDGMFVANVRSTEYSQSISLLSKIEVILNILHSHAHLSIVCLPNTAASSIRASTSLLVVNTGNLNIRIVSNIVPTNRMPKAKVKHEIRTVPKTHNAYWRTDLDSWTGLQELRNLPDQHNWFWSKVWSQSHSMDDNDKLLLWTLPCLFCWNTHSVTSACRLPSCV